MRNTLLLILFLLLSGQLCRVGLPWWGIAPLGMLAGWLFPQPAARSFLAAFAGGFLLWTIQAWWLDSANHGLLSARIGTLFMGLSATLLLLLTGILGGLLAGLGGLTGRWARDLVGHPAKVP